MLSLLFFIACGYQLACAWLVLTFRRWEVDSFCKGDQPPVTVLKPVYGWSERTAGCIETFRCLTYPHYEMVFTASRPEDPALAALAKEKIVAGSDSLAVNRKVAGLEAALPHCQHELIAISDADIKVDPDYLERVVAPFESSRVGLVTSLYRVGRVTDLGAAFEGLCIADFSASVLVARRTEGVSFALGATMAVRRQALEAIGGLAVLGDYLADDYQLGHRVAARGFEVVLAPTVVETDLGRVEPLGALLHQLRWMVTSRVSRPAGHAAFLVTQGLLWSALLGWPYVLFWLGWRWFTTALVWRGLATPLGRWWWLLPIKDLVYLGLWLASLVTDRVLWGGRWFRVRRDGKMDPLDKSRPSPAPS